MKTSLTSSIKVSSLLACSLFFLAGCHDKMTAASPEASQPSSPAKEAWQETKATAKSAAAATRDAVSDAWEKSKDATFKQREMVREHMKAAEASLDAKIIEWNAKKDAAKEDAKPAIAAARKEVAEAREVLSQKINALDNATEETWNSVKAELNTAWQRMTSAAADLAAKLQS
ncbi:hypothetical protein CMV30_01355 [Nibricoccus aquaticus]|uniref:Uncharacterized protein n=1 Tax=Nibricoccus aquaticus TaxID=2576891 RepID=A0A290Q246_9BACT|nr:hypothetical protein [Nibricoccus aquaticus]ATC62719.1 hypothetical protein CMV30_01355 [Nibricoccus aquaticus]